MSYTNGLDKPSDYFNTVLWTGDGTGARAITGVNFQPDLVWLKTRSTAYHHQLHDKVRGATAGSLYSSLNNAEDSNYPITSFNSDGFTLGNSASLIADSFASQNYNGTTYVAWNWLADNTSGSSNTDGSITSTVSANTTAGFSIVKWTGTGATGTIGHGLGVAPSCIITKPYSDAEDWGMYHVGMGNDRNISLNLSNAQYASNSAFWNNTNPSSTVFTVGSHPTINWNTKSIIAYVFAEKKGFSRFGSYQGSGNSDGPMIWCGFKPAFVLIKELDNASTNWMIYDNKRETYNPQIIRLFPNLSDAEVSNSGVYDIDLLSNGFKIRTTNNNFNRSGADHIFMAFAENPFVTSTGIPCTAR